jgi:hypothetical protein
LGIFPQAVDERSCFRRKRTHSGILSHRGSSLRSRAWMAQSKRRPRSGW